MFNRNKPRGIHDDLRLPFPFNLLFVIVPIVIGIVWLLVIAGLGWIAWAAFNGGFSPEAIGAFFGKIVFGFNGASQ